MSAKILRYYDSIGLIPWAGRTEAGYHIHSAKEVNAFRFIRRARDIGLSIERIKLSCWSDCGRTGSA